MTAAEIGLVMPLEPGGGDALLYFSGSGSPASLALGATTFTPRQMVFLDNFGGLGTQNLELVRDGDGRIDLDAIVVLH